MIAALTLAVLTTSLPVDPNTALPERWVMGDLGVPVAYQDHTMFLYADSVTVDGQIARSLIVVDGLEFIHPLDTGGPDFYWLTDATELPDGSLLVAALEVCTPGESYTGDEPACLNGTYTNDGWGFVVFDTDLFVVPDGLSPASWRLAARTGKLESGWWRDADTIEFSDQHPGMAFAANNYLDRSTYVYEFDVAEPDSGQRLGQLPMANDTVTAPVQTDNGWHAVTYSWADNTATFWSAPADRMLDGWVEGETIQYTAGPEAGGLRLRQTHAHGLNVVDGQVLHRWSTIRQRPTYEEVEL